MSGDDAALTAAIQDGMGDDDGAILENADPAGRAVNFNRSPARAFGTL